MGTEKRERQKANRAKRQIEQAHAVRASTIKRNVIRWGAAVFAAIAAVVLIAWVGGAFDTDETATGTLPDAGTITDDFATTIPIDSASTLADIPATTLATPADGAIATTVAPGETEMTDPTECPATDGSETPQQEFAAYPPMCIDATKNYTAEVVTNKGALTVELYADRAPLAVNSFVTLARYHYFDGVQCHRIIPNFVAQCGDPTATGRGGPGYSFDDELPQAGEYQIGSLAMANSGANTNGSQFFIITGSDGAALPPSYSLFGMITDGLDTTVPALDAAGSPGGVPPLEEVVIESVTITES